MSKVEIWGTAERAGLGDSEEFVQKLISVPLNPDNDSEGKFDLYYFLPLPDEHKLPKKTLLFCAGGPGRILKPGDDLWFDTLSSNGYEIVFFHLRGSGFSQIPESNDCDRFLRSKYAINDIEEIRKDWLKEKNWDAIIGYSYGAVLAQLYAERFKDNVDKLVLIGPISLDKFQNPANRLQAYEDYSKEVQRIRRQIVEKIFALEEFNDLSNKSKIMKELFGTLAESESTKGVEDREALGIFRQIDKQFAVDQILIDNYHNLKKRRDGNIDVLTKFGLNYSREFFEALGKLDRYGWQPLKEPEPVEEWLENIGKVIAKELGNEAAAEPARRKRIERGRSNAPRSLRAFEVMGVYDGINKRFMREWLGGGPEELREAIAKSAGEAQSEFIVNAQVKKIGIVETEIESIKSWDPAHHSHSRPTLILKGGSDFVTAGAQAERYLYDAVDAKEVVLLTFEGIGHEFILPTVDINSRIVNRVLRGDAVDTLDCIVSAFVERNFDEFATVAREVAGSLQEGNNILVTGR